MKATEKTRVAEVTFGLIGPLEVRCSGQSIPVPAARQRSLLAALLLRANEPVAKQRLCEAVWGERTSDFAETTLRSYVMRLRRVLGPSLADRLRVQPPGYQLRLEQDDELDLLRLQGCIRRGKGASQRGDWDRSIREFRDGLALWRGEPLCDVPSDTLQLSAVPMLSELRGQIWEGMHTAALHLGLAAELVAPLQRLIQEDPLSERFSALFITALASCDRRIDALGEFRRLRRALIAEQGVEPGPGLRELHQRLLTDEHNPTAVAPGPARVAIAAAANLIPRQLPPGAAAFTGRAREVGELAHRLTRPAGGDGQAAVVAITGFPGIGKSELAINVAHRVAGHYPDGQLYVDLRGSTAEPIGPGKVIEWFLRALGVGRREVPGDEAERVMMYRSMLARRQMLLLLDDALDEDQVRPLIPGSRTCRTLVTGRRVLPLLREARLVVLDAMTDLDAGDLLRAMVGEERVSSEPVAAASIVAACGGVPLALCIAAARLTVRPAWSLEHLAGLLADEEHRLDELAYGHASVRAGLEASYQGLGRSRSSREMNALLAFRMLGRWRSATITAVEAAALFGKAAPHATCALDALADANLLTSAAPGVYQLPVLARVFAAECATRTPSGRPIPSGGWADSP
jgi:DNA-binding SARP family transcriptional activator